MKTRHLTIVTASALGLALSACSGGGGNGGSDGNSGDVGEPQVQSFGLLKPAESDTEMANTLRKGLARESLAISDTDLVTSPSPPGVIAGDPAGGLESGDFSTTNLQEAGVDEADHVKYDGEILYILKHNTNYGDAPATADELGLSLAPPTVASIQLLRTDTENPGTEEVSRIDFESDSYGGVLYLTGSGEQKQVVNVENGTGFSSWLVFCLDYYWQEQETRVRSWNVSDPLTPTEAWSVQMDGSMLTSRVVDNVLYLVTRYTPTIEGLVPYPATDEALANNQALLDNANLEDLLPDITRNGGEPEELLAGTDCYVPNSEYEDIAAPIESGSLITVTAIDMEAPENINSICFNGFSSGYYVSRNSLYITSYGSSNHTLIHKVSLGDGAPEYRGSGEVPGYLGTRNPAFLMSESGDDLRVVSSTWDNFPFPLPETDDDQTDPEQTVDEGLDLGRHFLTVLRENPSTRSLDAIAQIPNAERPRKIGKPGEDLYAARFLGERAYLVTFQTIDPLYVLNLTNPQDPSIAGELEIPGFSTLLQPLSDELLLGVGQEVTVEQGAALTQGVKVALFNVGDIASPVELASVEIGKRGSYTPALDDHHALTLLESDGIHRLALPVSRYAEERNVNDEWSWYDWSDDGLYQFEVDSSAGSLEFQGVLISEQRSDSQQWPSYGIYNSRSVIHDDAVFFITEQEVISGRWGE